jgi:hypothetical protein
VVRWSKLMLHAQMSLVKVDANMCVAGRPLVKVDANICVAGPHLDLSGQVCGGDAVGGG